MISKSVHANRYGFFNTVQLAWSGDDASAFHINGGSIVLVNGTKAGFAGNLKANAKPIFAESTEGDITGGYDLILTGDLYSNTPGNWGMATQNTRPTTMQLYGSQDMATLSNKFTKWELKAGFDGKAGSMMSFESKHPGANPTDAANFFATKS